MNESNESSSNRKHHDHHHNESKWNPCQAVRDSCASWMESEPTIADRGRRSVSMDPTAIETLATSILQTSSTTTMIEWDTEGWHYDGSNVVDVMVRQERVGLYLLALDAINFCFWPTTDNDQHDSRTPPPTKTHINALEYHHLALAMKAVAERDDAGCSSFAFSPTSLRDMTASRMHDLLQPHLQSQDARISIPNLEQRAVLWRQVGQVLMDHFDGSIHQFWAQAKGDAPSLVSLVYHSFAGFQDHVDMPAASKDGDDRKKQQQEQQKQRIYFLKRAQILVGDWQAALPALKLSGMDQLTTFADYRVPQLLRQEGVLVYDETDNTSSLTALVDGQVELIQGGCHEVSIRAATVMAVETLVRCLNKTEQQEELFTAVKVDWYLWQVGEARHQEGRLKPFHKVRTHFY